MPTATRARRSRVRNCACICARPSRWRSHCNELTTNALKFGARSSSTGRLAVTWEIAAREGKPHLVFDWVESGLSLDPQAPRRHGFGTGVLLEMTAYNLGAEVDLTIAADGLR